MILITRQPAPPVKMVAYARAPRSTAAGEDLASVRLAPASSALPGLRPMPFALR